MVERMGLRQHLLHVISMALGPQELLGLERQDLRLCLAGMSSESVRPMLETR